jgi:hypothetical protein
MFTAMLFALAICFRAFRCFTTCFFAVAVGAKTLPVFLVGPAGPQRAHMVPLHFI